MTYHGKVQNGRVILDETVDLPDGTEVVVSLVDNGSKNEETATSSMYERWKPIIGIAKHLPPDASTKIDEVLYGRTDE